MSGVLKHYFAVQNFSACKFWFSSTDPQLQCGWYATSDMSVPAMEYCRHTVLYY